VAEGHLPSYLSLEDEDAVEEERRLFYVAATRAKKNLFLLKPHIDRSPRSFMNSGGTVFTQTSRFLDEGGIMREFLQVEGAGEDYDIDDGEFKDAPLPKEARDKEFLEMMKEYFRYKEDY
jgi:ATP-dependent exoDNAse (exonuclease V) beta subunit